MKKPKCLTCKNQTELVLCHCQEPRKVYYCWTCRKHYPLKTKSANQQSRLDICSWCAKEYRDKKLCPECKKRRSQPNEVHHGEKAPGGKCQQCLEPAELIKEWNGKFYCKDCKNWNDEGGKAGIGCYNKRFLETWCRNCGTCNSCKGRKKHLTGVPTRDLMIEVMKREDFEALLSWEDDDFKQRYGEIMWELGEVQGWTPKQIEIEVNKDIFEKKISQRKFSRGT